MKRQRRSRRIPNAACAIPRLARRYAQAIRQDLTDQVRLIALYGSRARGDAHAGSDYDFLVVLSSPTQKERETVTAAGAKLLAETDQLCTALVYSPEQWERVQQSPLGWNILREGVEL
ncbi:MAG TPA: nucleotidyltransferase domain-containing protein [Kiritimatiellia bacterium]|nr:MAG: Nucleotidyltransferase domain protein [Verrucomicrobia bacterium ADurb.Bin018]HOE01261.1 nucleotidyltransferase domain-containing protein [Kiritimatiellia bacterium]HOE36613.1 nucleotidyltransferase domain-containing protein [Kiritimatiellia bacterium]HOR74047.1 nucleotidyltransferase domain-containing protein [Kiritimatiellia bacterium]HOU58881.1 nucleotidyltransferase domain-containing protein [Kiritimatiellia bacterium]